MPDLPAGTVTFVFSDLEGSTRLLKQLGDAGYIQMLALHRQIVREVFATHDGSEIERLGPVDVLECALAQLAHGDPFGQVIADDRSGRLGKQDLPALTVRGNSRGANHVQPGIALIADDRLARVQPEPSLGPWRHPAYELVYGDRIGPGDATR